MGLQSASSRRVRLAEVQGTDEELRFLMDLRNSSRHFYVDQSLVSWEQQQRWWTRARSDPDNRYFIVWLDDLRIGVGRFHGIVSDPVGVGGDIIERLRGRGLGRALFKTLICQAWETYRPPRIWLRVRDFNTPALNLYRSLGFQQIDESGGLILMTLQPTGRVDGGASVVSPSVASDGPWGAKIV